MPKARWWLVAALAAGQTVMLLVTVSHGGGQDGEVPRYGFPLPWTWFSGFSSLHWDVAPLAWLVDLAAHTLALAPFFLALGSWLSRAGADAERWGRRLALGLVVLAAAVFGLLEVLPAALGWRHLVWAVPPGGPVRTLAVAPFPPT